MNFLKATLKTLGPRLIGVICSTIAGIIAEKTKGAVTIDPETATAVITGSMIGSYAVAHRVASSFINPGDAAKSRLAEAEKIATNYGSSVVVRPPTH